MTSIRHVGSEKKRALYNNSIVPSPIADYSQTQAQSFEEIRLYCFPFIARSCSMICLLHLPCYRIRHSAVESCSITTIYDSPSAWIESAFFWKPCPYLLLRADPPHKGRDTNDHPCHDGCVCFPVRRLCIPSSCG